jgi:hypothetical protein
MGGVGHIATNRTVSRLEAKGEKPNDRVFVNVRISSLGEAHGLRVLMGKWLKAR